MPDPKEKFSQKLLMYNFKKDVQSGVCHAFSLRWLSLLLNKKGEISTAKDRVKALNGEISNISEQYKDFSKLWENKHLSTKPEQGPAALWRVGVKMEHNVKKGKLSERFLDLVDKLKDRQPPEAAGYLVSVDTSRGEAHTVAIYHDGANEWLFFDPNGGEYDYDKPSVPFDVLKQASGITGVTTLRAILVTSLGARRKIPIIQVKT